MKIGQLIADHRKKRGLSLQEMAKEIGISYAAVWRLEQGRVETKQWPALVRWVFAK